MSGDPVLTSFARALEYPGDDLMDCLAACVASVMRESVEAAHLVAEFKAFAEHTPAGPLEELYTAAFDLQEGSAPYLGAHLFRGDPRRGAFMARLAESYRAHGFSVGSEVPDHLGVVLRYLARRPADEEAADLLSCAVVPAGTAGAAVLARQAHPWEPLVRALLLVVSERAAALTPPAAASPSNAPGRRPTEGENR